MAENTQTLKVLVVDDEATIRDFMTRFLQNLGHEVDVAEDGSRGIEKVAVFCPDVVLADICMPRMNGIQFLKAVRKLSSPPSVILLTGYGDMDSAIEALREGAYDYMLKPVNSQDLIFRLTQLAKMKALELRAEADHERTLRISRMAALGKLASGVSGKIHDPVTYLRSSTQIMRVLLNRLYSSIGGEPEELRDQAEKLCQQMPELLQGMEDNAERIRQIAYGLSGFASGEEWSPRNEGSINACIDDALVLVGDFETIDIEVEEGRDIGLVPICRRSVTQALLCIIMNSVQACKNRNCSKIRIRSLAEENGNVAVIIEDSGKGIPEEIRGKIIEPFFTTKKEDNCIGLGLSVAHGIICIEHGGQLEVGKSELGGASVRVTLPKEITVEGIAV